MKNEKEKQQKATELLNELYDLFETGDNMWVCGQIELKKWEDSLEFVCSDDYFCQYWTKTLDNNPK